MIFHRSLLIFSVLLSHYALGHSQDKISDWLGHWQGDLIIYRVQDTVMQLPMELIIRESMEADSIYDYTLVYQQEGKPEDRRAYALHILDDDQGVYRLDEQNGITISVRRQAGSLYSLFDVMTSRLMTRQRLLSDDLMAYEIDVASLASEHISPADTILNIPEVKDWHLISHHRALLHKNEK